MLQTIHKEMGGIEGVEKMMGESEEARAYQEVSLFPGLVESCIVFWMLIHGSYYRKSAKCLLAI